MSVEMIRRGTFQAVAAFLLVVLAGGCASDQQNPLAGEPDWREEYEEGSRQPWVDTLAADYLVTASGVKFIRATTSQSGDMPYLVFEASLDTSSEALKLPDTEAGQLLVFESLGVDRHPSVFEGLGEESVQLLLSRSNLDSRVEDDLGTDLHVIAAFTADLTGRVSFRGPFAKEIEEELRSALKLVGRDGQSEYDLLVELAAEPLARDAETGEPTGRIRREIGAEFARRQDPFDVWKRTPPDQRGIDPEVTPPEVLGRMTDAHVFVEVNGTWAAGSTVRILTDEGVALSVMLEGFSDGYVIAVPPGSPWRIQVLDDDGRPAVPAEVRVPAAQWASSNATYIVVTPKQLEASPLTIEQYEVLRRSAAEPPEATGRTEPPGG